MGRLGRRLGAALLGGATVLAVVGTAGAAGAAGTGSGKAHLPPQGSSGVSAHVVAHQTGTVSSSQSITDTPGNVYAVAPPHAAVSSPTADPADLIGASASATATTVTLTAQTVSELDPFTDPGWVLGDTYIAWQLDTTLSGSAEYTAYFQVNTDGTADGELAYEPDDSAVSCNVNETYNSTVGYQVTFATSCLPGVTSFQWNVFSNYDPEPITTDPTGADAFGKQLPDRHDGGSLWAPVVTIPPPVAAAVGVAIPTYWLFAKDGGVFSFNAPFYGSVPGVGVSVDDVVGGTTTLDHQGYWMVGSDGGVFAFGDARFYGSEGGQKLNAPVVGIESEPTGDGYWEVASDGGVFSFGGAGYFGSEGGQPLSQPIVAIVAADDGGYWLIGEDGGVFAFGDAGYYGSLPGLGITPAQPIVGGAATPDGKGYWLVGADGGVYAFGDAGYFGSMAGTALVGPVVGMVATPDGGGYWLDATDGGVFSFGDTSFYGSLGGHPRSDPIVAMGVAS